VNKLLSIYVTALLIGLGLAFAQGEARAPIATEPLFDNLIGTWEGEGWTMLSPDQRVEFNQLETIEVKANGHVVVVEGLGSNKETGEAAFQAFGIFSYDLTEGKYQFTAYQTNGYSVTVEPEIMDERFIWGFDTGQGLVRYTADITATTWSQIGEFSPNGGENWFQNFEMTLTKVK